MGPGVKKPLFQITLPTAGETRFSIVAMLANGTQKPLFRTA